MKVELSVIENLHVCEDGHLLGTMQIGTTLFHCMFLRVTTDEATGEQTIDSEDEGARANWYDGVCRLDEAAFSTIEVPGHPGEWVLTIFPYGR